MKYLFELDKDCPSLSLSETLAVSHATKHKIDENILTLESLDVKPETFVQRLSLTKAVYQHFFTTTRQKLSDSIKKHKWSIEEPIKVETRNATPEERKQVITMTCKALNNPKVMMETPATKIYYIYTKKKVHCGILIGEPKLDLSAAMEKMPAPHPSAMKPRIVKALINISKPDKKILDPFCGAGGFIAQASKMGYEAEGWDIDKGMIWRAKKNTAKLKNVSIKNKNALTLKKAESIIADLPYGKNTRKQNMKKLYERFFKTLKKARFNKAVLVLPKSSQPVKMARKEGLLVLKTHEMYIHGSLTRVIMEIEK